MASLENPNPDKKCVLDIQDELLAMPAWKTLSRIQHFGVSIRLLERNAQELQEMLHFLTEDPDSERLFDIRRRADLDLAIEEVLRLLHNFVAAALTLVDHTRVVFRELYEKAALFPDYQAEIDRRFVHAPLIQFVQKLRHLAQHVRLPHVSYLMNFKQDSGIARTLVLNKTDLLQFDGWTAPAMAFLASAPEKVDLSGVVEDYANEVRSFYQWMVNRQSEIHASEIAAIDEVQAKGQALLAPEVPGFLKSDLATWAEGLCNFQSVFASVFSPDDWVDLSIHDGDLVAWTAAAISLTEQRFGSLPAELVASLKDAALRGR